MKYAAILAILLLMACSQPPVPERIPIEETPRYHGADMLTIGWKGEMTAYRWDGKKYIVMWKRRVG